MNEVHMTTAGWFFLGATWGAVIMVTAYCVCRLLRSQKRSGSEKRKA